MIRSLHSNVTPKKCLVRNLLYADTVGALDPLPPTTIVNMWWWLSDVISAFKAYFTINFKTTCRDTTGWKSTFSRHIAKRSTLCTSKRSSFWVGSYSFFLFFHLCTMSNWREPTMENHRNTKEHTIFYINRNQHYISYASRHGSPNIHNPLQCCKKLFVACLKDMDHCSNFDGSWHFDNVCHMDSKL